MCGIAGIYNYRTHQPVDRELLTTMTKELYHRGPDGEGYYYEDKIGIGLGHRRLSIIDLQTGKQPMTNEDETIWITYNGELYNYLELKNILSSYYQFKTKSDTEVIINAYKHWGIDSLNRLNGIFAFGIWDKTNKQLILSRDPLGVKPIYYYYDNNIFMFSSEIKSILKYNNYNKEIDFEAINQLISFRFVPSPKTAFNKINKIAPGHYIIINQNKKIENNKYWYLNNYTVDNDNTDFIEGFGYRINNAIKRQMMSDVDIGLYLSGGLDSSLVAKIMSDKLTRIKCFSAEFDDNKDYNEGEYANQISKLFNLDLTTVDINADSYIQNFNNYIHSIEEPISNFSGIAWLFLSNAANENNIKVILSGQGADEPLGGYDKYLGEYYRNYFKMIELLNINKYLENFIINITPLKYQLNNQIQRAFNSLHIHNENERFLNIISPLSIIDRKKIFHDNYFVNDNFINVIDERLKDVEDLDSVNKLMFLDTQLDLPDNLLLVADKMNMSNSVELRVPFLDLDLFSFLFSINKNEKVRYFNKKYSYKKYLHQHFSKNFVNRKKIGFYSPINRYFRDKYFINYFKELIEKRDSFSKTFFNYNYVEEKLYQHINLKKDNKFLLYQVLMIELWFKKYFSD